MAYSRTTLLLLAQLAPRLRKETLRTVDLQYMGMSARYADHVLGLALKSRNPELKALGALLRHDFFGPAGLFPGGRMLWSAPDAEAATDIAANDGPETLDFSDPPGGFPNGVTDLAGMESAILPRVLQP
jgi:hypothetical protein